MRVHWTALAAWSGALALATIAMLAVRPELDKAHVALVLLLIVLGASASAGRTIGVAVAALSFLVFNWFFLPPYYTFIIADPLDWMVLAAFLVTGLVAAQLLYRAQEEARSARERAAEVDRLASLGAETLSVGSAEASLKAVAELVRTSLAADRCEVVLRDPGDDSLAMWSRTTGNAAIIQRDGTVHVHSPGPDESASRALGARDALALLLPLRTHDRVVGVLRVERDAGLRLDRSGWRFLDAMSYYAALAVERVRLVAEAERTEALRETNRLKDALLASVSHDLRTPLTSIKALAHDLAALGDERAEMIENEADRLNQTVADLLALSQLNAGVLPVKVELNAVDELVGALLERVEPVIGASRIRVSLPPGDPLLMGNFDLVHSVRILANLVENSARYAPADTTIEVDVSREGDSLLFRVSDRGPGIDRSRVAQMFEPFQRNDGGFRGDGGAGLGLSIARRLAEVQSGNLTYAPRLGGGSVFTLTLPAADLTGETPTALRERPTPESL